MKHVAKRLSLTWQQIIAIWVALVVTVFGTVAVPVFVAIVIQWVFIPVWGRYGFWIWAHGGSSSGSW
jgi:hypothetical protein